MKPSAINTNPDTPDLFVQLINKADPDSALQLARAFVIKFPAVAKAHFLLGEALRAAGQDEHAIAAYREAIRLDAENIVYGGRLAELYARSGLVKDSLDLYLGLLSYSKSPPFWLHVGLGNAYARLGERDRAVEYFAKALAQNPEAVELRNRAITIYEALGVPGKAIDLYEQEALNESDIETPSSYIKRIAEADSQHAEEVAAEFVNSYPSLAKAHFALGEILRARGCTDEALAAFREAVRIEPNNHGYRGRLGDLLANAGLFSDAVTQFQAILASSESPPFWVYVGLGNAYERLGELELAVEAFAKALSEKPDMAVVRNRTIAIFETLGRPHDAIELYTQEASQELDSIRKYSLLRHIGRLAAEKGDPARATRAFREAAKIKPLGAASLIGEPDSEATHRVEVPTLDSDIADKAAQELRARLGAAHLSALGEFLSGQSRLAWPVPASPKVSVVVALYGRAELTLRCLHALAASTERALELILVDNASPDATPQLLERIDGATILRNTGNTGFVKAVNQGARAARGEYLLFLNSGAEVAPGAIEALVALLDGDAGVGGAGGRLVHPDGRLQEAGSILWRDGSCQGYGRGGDPGDPRYAFRREVDYCSAALFLTRRGLFLADGGFDEQFSPGYYEEVDYCARLQQAGHRVLYEPNAVAYHFEFASSSGRDKAIALQLAHRALFAAKHAEWLQGQYAPAAENEVFARSRPKRGLRILFVDDRLPDPAEGRYGRALEIVRALASLGHDVSHFGMLPVRGDPARDGIPATLEVLPGHGPAKLLEHLAGRLGYYDRTLVSRPINLRPLAAHLGLLPRPLIYDAEGVWAESDALVAEVRGETQAPEVSAQALNAELELGRAADTVTVVSESDQAAFESAGCPRVVLVSHAVTRERLRDALQEALAPGASPAVSLCIPTYNGAAFLRAALDSALAQTWRDFELLVVDDGSNDDTIAIVQEYAARDRRVRLERNARRLGIPGNWNRCLELARGEWIKFLFQDDLLAPTCLERMLQAAAAQPGAGLVACRRDFAYEPSVPQKLREAFANYVSLHNMGRAFPGLAFVPPDAFAGYMVRAPTYNCVGEPTAVLLRRSAVERFGRFHPDLVQFVDLEYWARIAVHTGLAYVDETLATFRLHQSSATADNRLARQYRMDVIDPLVIRYELAYAPGYAPVRSAAKRASPKADLRALAREAAKAAREVARRHAENRRKPDPGPLQEWERAARERPKLRI